MEPWSSVSGMKPHFVQQSSSEAWLDFVATEMGRGGILMTSTSSPRMPVMHVLAPPSIMHGRADASKASAANAKQLTRAYTPLLPLRPKMHGRPTTH